MPLAEAAEALQLTLFLSTCLPAFATQALLAGLHGGQDAANKKKGRALASEPLHAS